MVTEPGTDPAERSRCPWGTSALLALVLLVFWGASGCAWLNPHEAVARPVPPDVTGGIEQALAQRSHALRTGREDAFLSTTVAGDFRRAQRLWFENLRDLGVTRFSQRLVGDPIERESAWVARVRTSVQIRGVDRVPLVSTTSVAFVATQHGWRISSSTPLPGTSGGSAQVWDTGRIVVRRAPGIVVVAEVGHEQAAATVVASARRALDVVQRQVPRRWRGDVLIQAASGTAPLARIGNLPGGVAERLDAVTWRVRGGATGRQLAGARMLLNPRVLGMSEADRARVLRHELTHVALGVANERIPIWLSEGVAQYVAQAPEGTSRRVISASAVDAAAQGLVRLPSDDEMREQATAAQYGFAWMACEAIVRQGGDAQLWRLVDAMAARGQQTAAETLQAVTGLTESQLARRSATEIRTHYR